MHVSRRVPLAVPPPLAALHSPTLLPSCTSIYQPIPPQTNRNIEKYDNAVPPHPQIVAVRLDAPLFFANTPHFESTIRDYLAAAQAAAASCECVGRPCVGSGGLTLLAHAISGSVSSC